MNTESPKNPKSQPPSPAEQAPIKVPNPPEGETGEPAAEIPKVGSRDAPGG